MNGWTESTTRVDWYNHLSALSPEQNAELQQDRQGAQAMLDQLGFSGACPSAVFRTLFVITNEILRLRQDVEVLRAKVTPP